MTIPFGSKKTATPAWPDGYVREECDAGPYCPKCDSTQVWPWGLLGKLFRAKPLGCINRDCEAYHLRAKPEEKTGIAAEVAKAESGKLPEERQA
jgi:hypothetical protein